MKSRESAFIISFRDLPLTVSQSHARRKQKDRREMEAERGIHFWCHIIRSTWIHNPCPLCFIWRKFHQEQWAESRWQPSTLPSVGTTATLWTGPVTASPLDKQLFSHFPLESFLRTDHTELSQCDDRVNLRNFKKEQLLTSKYPFPTSYFVLKQDQFWQRAYLWTYIVQFIENFFLVSAQYPKVCQGTKSKLAAAVNSLSEITLSWGWFYPLRLFTLVLSASLQMSAEDFACLSQLWKALSSLDKDQAVSFSVRSLKAQTCTISVLCHLSNLLPTSDP